jgi:Tfp pilus assembly protein PilF
MALVLCAWALPAAGQVALVKGDVKVSREKGFTRLAIRLAEEVPSKVTLNNTILIVSFARPVNVSVDMLNAVAPDIISAARRDPDGTAIRIALAHPFKMNAIPAAEWLFIDLLPEKWSGVLPGAPQVVVDELARRAREAEERLRAQGAGPKPAEVLSARVKVAVQPTFTRFFFALPDGVGVSSERGDHRFTLRFGRQIRWDLADALAVLPKGVDSLDADIDVDGTRVSFVLSDERGLRSFQDGHTLIVDIENVPAKLRNAAAAPEKAPAAAEKAPAASEKTPVAPEKAPPEKATPAIAAPETVPAGKAQPPPQQNDAQADKSSAPATAPAESPPPASPPAAAQTKPSPPAQHAAAPVRLPSPPAPDPNAPVAVAVEQSGHTLQLTFPFATPTPAAVFRRGDTVWLVFDSAVPIRLSALQKPTPGLRDVVLTRGGDDETVIRLKLDRPRFVSATADDASWTITIADTLAHPPLPLSIVRSLVSKTRADIVVPFMHAKAVHHLPDPEIGDRLTVITALPPARGFLTQRQFVELHALATSQGVVVRPLADDVEARIAPDKIVLSRPGGLALSTPGLTPQATAAAAPNVTFDPQVWGFDRHAPFLQRETELIRAAAAAPEGKRWGPRLELARFYLARGMAVEAKGVLDVALSDQRNTDDITGSILSAVCNVMLRRPEEAMKTLSAPRIGAQQDAEIWRGMALAKAGQWAEARAHFKALDAGLATLPLELQRMVLQEALRTAVEVRDYAGAGKLAHDLQALGVSPEMQAETAVLIGRLDEGLGRTQDALAKYQAAVASSDRRAAAQGRFHEIRLKLSTGNMPRKDAITALESLTTAWRGDHTEAEGLRLLAHLYIEAGRYRDAFHVMKTAVLAHPKSDLTRHIQDEAAAAFETLFLGDQGDAMPPVEALGLFYDYRELTPIGRRGDEMIRKLADRLVSVDLLSQAAELLQHQVDHRLEGAARAQVAAKLAAIYLMNRKPERALATLHATRDSDVSNELREHRLLLEARALSELGRHGLALDLIAGLHSHEATRLRGDILWTAKRWREAAEQIELLHGQRWREFRPLSESERSDILRAGIGYALADEPLSLARLRERYAAKMAEGPDARAFNVVTAPIGTGGPEFQDVARRVISVDTLAGFLHDIETRFDGKREEKTVRSEPPAKPSPTPEKPQAAPAPPAPEEAPPKPPAGGEPLRPDPMPTGSIPKRKL